MKLNECLLRIKWECASKNEKIDTMRQSHGLIYVSETKNVWTKKSWVDICINSDVISNPPNMQVIWHKQRLWKI